MQVSLEQETTTYAIIEYEKDELNLMLVHRAMQDAGLVPKDGWCLKDICFDKDESTITVILLTNKSLEGKDATQTD